MRLIILVTSSRYKTPDARNISELRYYYTRADVKYVSRKVEFIEESSCERVIYIARMFSIVAEG